MTQQDPYGKEEVIEGKIFALLAYLSIFCIIPLIFKKENSFALRHGKQGLIIFVGEVAAFVLHIVLGSWFLKLSMFVFGILSLIGIVAVLQGRYIKIPVASEIADTIYI